MNANELYRLNAELADIGAQLEDNGGEITPDIDSRLTEVARRQEDFVNGFQALLQQQADCHNAIQAEIKRLQAIDRARTAKAETLKKWLLFYMQQNGIDEIAGPYGSVRLTKGRQSVVIDAEKAEIIHKDMLDAISRQLPSYIKAKFEYSKTALKEEIDKGRYFDFAQVVTNPGLLIK